MAKYYETYDKDTDYQSLINQAVSNGDMASAAVYEQQRNNKIAGTGSPYAQTNNYSQYLPGTGTQRSSYSVQESTWGSAIDELWNKMNNQPEFSYKDAPTYNSRWQGQIDQRIEDYLNRPSFSYDPATDPLYSVYKKEYAREGQRASQDALAQAAALTGGRASSWANTAAQQAGNYYAAKTADAIPTLQQLAWQMYLGEDDLAKGRINLLQGQDLAEYNQYADQLAQYNRDRDFEYNKYRDGISDTYNMYNVAAGQQSYNYSASQQDMALARDEIDKYLAAGGSASGIPADLLARSGYSTAYINALEAGYANQGRGYGGGNTVTATGNNTDNGGPSFYTSPSSYKEGNGMYPDKPTAWNEIAADPNISKATAYDRYTSNLNSTDPLISSLKNRENYEVANGGGNGFINVTGIGRVGASELQDYIENKTIVPVYDDNRQTVTFKKAGLK